MNRIRKILVCVIVLLSSQLSGQEKELSLKESESLKLKIVQKSKSTFSITSDFKQLKHMDFLTNDIVSSGELIYKSPSNIKWEYKMPFAYSAIFKENKLFINDDGEKSNLNLNKSKAFRSLNDLIIKSVRGDLFDDEAFSMRYFESKDGYVVKFSPKDKVMKSFIREMIITFDRHNFQVLELKMMESESDYTLLRFLNQELNAEVSDSVFIN